VAELRCESWWLHKNVISSSTHYTPGKVDWGARVPVWWKEDAAQCAYETRWRAALCACEADEGKVVCVCGGFGRPGRAGLSRDSGRAAGKAGSEEDVARDGTDAKAATGPEERDPEQPSVSEKRRWAGGLAKTRRCGREVARRGRRCRGQSQQRLMWLCR
jgi:hypothetical protein